MAIRRFADSHKDKPDSIWWIVERIRVTPSLASRRALTDAVVAGRGGDADAFVLERVNRDFDRLAGDGDLPSTEALGQLQARLKASAKAVVAYADRRIAHLDPRGGRRSLTFTELHQALDEVAAIANVVSVLLTSSHTMFDLVTVQHDWTECFRPGLFPTPIEHAAWFDGSFD